jgi:hypothetical protein
MCAGEGTTTGTAPRLTGLSQLAEAAAPVHRGSLHLGRRDSPDHENRSSLDRAEDNREDFSFDRMSSAFRVAV